MTLSENHILDIQVLRQDRSKESAGFAFDLADELIGDPVAKKYLIKGIFAPGEQSCWFAPPGGLKSALLMSASVHIAAGLPWFGRRNKAGQVGVVYFALERAALSKRRLQTMRKMMGLSKLPIAVVNATFGLMKPQNVRRVVQTIRDAERAMGLPAGFVVYDTFAKLISVDGGDDSTSRDQGKVYASLDQIAKLVPDVHQAVVGHPGKDEERGFRGSNASYGHFDLMVQISGEDIKSAKIVKANEVAEGPLFSFRSEIHDFGTDEDGDPNTVNVVVEAEKTAGKLAEPKLTENQRVMFRLVHEAGAGGISLEDWNTQARTIGIDKKQRQYELRMALKDKGMVREYNGRWFVSNG